MTEFTWTFGFHDATPIGFIAFGLYLLASGLCLASAYLTRDDIEWAGMWLLAGSFLGAMGINKQFDLHNLVRDFGRVLSAHQGWYDSRRLVQFIIMAFVLVVGLVVAGLFLWYFAEALIDQKIMIAGFTLLIGLIVFQASAFHHFNPLGFLVDYLFIDVIELLALSLIGFDAAAFLYYEFSDEEDDDDFQDNYHHAYSSRF